MNPQRFLELTQAYGATPERWPVAERDSALALLRRDDEVGDAARIAQAHARAIDDALSAYRVATPDLKLIEQVAASFHERPVSAKQGRIGRWTWRRSRIWISGVGLLGAGAVGVVSGVVMMSLFFSAASMSHTASEQAFAGSVFSNSASDWSEE